MRLLGARARAYAWPSVDAALAGRPASALARTHAGAILYVLIRPFVVRSSARVLAIVCMFSRHLACLAMRREFNCGCCADERRRRRRLHTNTQAAAQSRGSLRAARWRVHSHRVRVRVLTGNKLIALCLPGRRCSRCRRRRCGRGASL